MTLGFPKNTEMEAELTFVRNAAGAGGAGGGRGGGGRGGGGGFFEGVGSVAATRRSGQHPRASFDRRAAGCQLQDAAVRPAVRLRRARVRELCRAARPADDTALHPASSAAEEGPDGGHQRTRQADHLLPRPRRTRADPLGAARRCAVVGPGVRGCRLSQRVSRRAPARRRQPARHPLQRHQLGAPLDARLEHGRQRQRSAHR